MKQNIPNFTYRDFHFGLVEPKKEQVTAEALRYLQKFTEESLSRGIKVVGDYLLTSRENQVIEMMMQGMSTDEIAESLGKAETTVRSFQEGIYDKYGISGKNRVVKAVMTYLKRTGRV